MTHNPRSSLGSKLPLLPVLLVLAGVYFGIKKFSPTVSPVTESAQEFINNLGQAFNLATKTITPTHLTLTIPQGDQPSKVLTFSLPPPGSPVSFGSLISVLKKSRLHDHRYDVVQYNCVDFSKALYDELTAQQITTRFVGISFKNETVGHALVAALTTDRGWIWIDFTPLTGDSPTGQIPSQRLVWVAQDSPLLSLPLEYFDRLPYEANTFVQAYREKEALTLRIKRLSEKIELYKDQISRSSNALQKAETPATAKTKNLSSQIDMLKGEIDQLKNELDRNPGQSPALINDYNSKVQTYNGLVETLRTAQQEVSHDLEDHNKWVTEANTLQRELAETAEKLNALRLPENKRLSSLSIYPETPPLPQPANTLIDRF